MRAFCQMMTANEAASIQEKWLQLAQEKTVDTETMKDFLEKHPELDIDCTDSTGMTVLQHAAFRGNEELCVWLLSKGANVNSDKHEHKYTTLMFAALSGSEETVNLLLEAGADPESRNSVKRNAAEMAAFVANYHIGGVIENFFPSKDLHRFTKSTGQETRPKLKSELVESFHSFMSSYNIHPIYLLRVLQTNPQLLDDSKYLRQILDMLVLEKMNAHNTHESLALKFHYLSCVLEHAGEAKEKSGNLDALIKRLATGRASDGFLINIESLVRSTLRSFPRTESNLFQMLLQKISKIEVGDAPTGVMALTDAINGNRMRSEEDPVCDVCGTRKPKKCQGCLDAWYCCKECQKLHRPTHKKFCKKADSSAQSETKS